ncbi:type II secretion system protein [bacterium]|nr:type II secretion system protein [bacterium]MBQ9246907.1 type II secretion system protein [bacterium]
MFYNRLYKKGFTLTEVLLAIAIVGVISALVLPTIISHYNDSVLTRQKERLEKSVESAITTLAVTENKQNFSQTIMYNSETPEDYENYSGAFIKKYLKVSKYYGDFSTNKTEILSKCFAPSYYLYSDKDKKPYGIESDLSGACATLKDGASICLGTQVKANSIPFVYDINGPKGPNVVNKDYFVSSIPAVNYKSFDQLSKATQNIATQDNPNLAPMPNGCVPGDYSTDCCKWYGENGLITDADHGCCDNSAFVTSGAAGSAACVREIALRLNLYPSSCTLTDESCRMFIRPQSTTAKQGSVDISAALGVNPPDILLYCDGVYAGNMPGSTLMGAIKSTSSAEEDNVYFAMSRTSAATCGYQTGEGIKPSKSSVVFKTDGTYSNYSYNGIKWTVTYF